MRIGITGHSNLSPNSVRAVADALRGTLVEFGKPLTGVSCLARGADQLFAQVVLEVGGDLHDIDVLLAVWDGMPPDGRGGTGDTVQLARARGVPVTVVWPPGAERS